MNSRPFQQRLWESNLTKTVGKLFSKTVGNLSDTDSEKAIQQRLWEIFPATPT